MRQEQPQSGSGIPTTHPKRSPSGAAPLPCLPQLCPAGEQGMLRWQLCGPLDRTPSVGDTNRTEGSSARSTEIRSDAAPAARAAHHNQSMSQTCRAHALPQLLLTAKGGVNFQSRNPSEKGILDSQSTLSDRGGNSSSPTTQHRNNSHGTRGRSSPSPSPALRRSQQLQLWAFRAVQPAAHAGRSSHTSSRLTLRGQLVPTRHCSTTEPGPTTTTEGKRHL